MVEDEMVGWHHRHNGHGVGWTPGDIILAEPDALICFAGPRVIEQTIGEKLPEGVQHAEFLLEHGMLDMVVKRSEMQDVLYRLLVMHR